GIRDFHVTGVQTCALPISDRRLPQLVPGPSLRTQHSPVAGHDYRFLAPHPAGPDVRLPAVDTAMIPFHPEAAVAVVTGAAGGIGAALVRELESSRWSQPEGG